jgi:peptide/nickel transport system permease protein
MYQRISKFWSRFSKDKSATVGVVIIALAFFMAISAPLLPLRNPDELSGEVLRPPSVTHPFGTDTLGRDVLSRIVWGSRRTLYLGFGAAILAAVVGVIVGAFSGYMGGKIDNLLMRLTDFTLVMPSYFFFMLIFATFRSYDPSIMFFAIALLMWPTMCRIVRSEFLSLKEREFVKAARAIGASNIRIIFRELLPNAVASIVVVMSMNVAYAILWSSALSYMGFGDPSAVDWANMLNEGRSVMRTGWWLAAIPGLMIFLVVFAFNLVGDGLRDALDPRLRGE